MKRVLFVCIGNCCRSQMAEGFARHYGQGIIMPSSSGLSPTTSVARETISVMAELGVDIRDQFPKQFEARAASACDVVVNLSGYDLPALANAVVLEWDVEDPFYEELPVYRRVRDEIADRVHELIATIQKGQLPLPVKRPGLWEKIRSLY